MTEKLYEAIRIFLRCKSIKKNGLFCDLVPSRPPASLNLNLSVVVFACFYGFVIIRTSMCEDVQIFEDLYKSVSICKDLCGSVSCCMSRC